MTIELSPEDALELRLLLDSLKKEKPIVYEMGMHGSLVGRWSLDRERELRRGVEALERLLKQ